MKTEAQLKAKLDAINILLSDEMDIYVNRTKVAELRREKYYLEEVLEIPHKQITKNILEGLQ